MAHTWQPNFPTHFYYGYSLVTNSHATQSGIFQNTATNNKFTDILLLYIGRLHSIDYSLFFSFLILTELIDYIKINLQIKEAKQFHNADR